MKNRTFVKEVFSIIRKNEKEIKKMYEESDLSKPIAIDIVTAKRNMAYNDIVSLAKKFKFEKENE